MSFACGTVAVRFFRPNQMGLKAMLETATVRSINAVNADICTDAKQIADLPSFSGLISPFPTFAHIAPLTVARAVPGGRPHAMC